MISYSKRWEKGEKVAKWLDKRKIFFDNLDFPLNILQKRTPPPTLFRFCAARLGFISIRRVLLKMVSIRFAGEFCLQAAQALRFHAEIGSDVVLWNFLK